MRKKPLIGITCNFDRTGRVGMVDDMGEWGQKWSYLYSDYIDIVKKAGGIAVIIPIYEDNEAALELVDRLDGVLISGGNDVSPLQYGQRISYAGGLCEERDTQDFAVIRRACERGIPVFGICRGIQAINVVFGGTLHQDLGKKGYLPHALDHVGARNTPVHTVQLAEQSAFAKALGKREVWVNSYHHCGVDRVAEGFAATAVSEDGVVEAIERTEGVFIAAVQWHPEMMFDSDEQLTLVKVFVDACAAGLPG